MNTTLNQKELKKLDGFLFKKLQEFQALQRQAVCDHPVWTATKEGQVCDSCGLEVKY